MGMGRARLREALRGRRAGLLPDRRSAGSAAIAAAVQRHPTWGGARAVAGFVGVRGEPDTRALLEAALREGKRLWLPRVVDDSRLQWVAVDDLDGQLRPGTFGLLEPVEREGADVLDRITAEADIDLVLVPGLAFASSGARIGFGCGYYDRALEGVASAAHPVRIGVCFSGFLDPPEGPIPADGHDVPMHLVVTEHGVVSCAP
jgi:5-formyltetrahydrofolate cyclo-ligase